MTPASSSSRCEPLATPPNGAHAASQLSETETPSPPRQRCPHNAALGKIYVSGHNFGTFCTQDGIPQLTVEGEEWILSRTGQWPSFRKLRDARTPAAFCFPELSSHDGSRNQRMDLPEKCIVHALLNAYLASDFRLVFPMLDGVLFEDTIRLAYREDPGLALEKRSAKACVFAFFSMVSPRYLECEAALLVNGDACAAEAQVLLSDVLENSSVTTLQTVLMLVCDHFRLGFRVLNLGSLARLIPFLDRCSSHTRPSLAACKPRPCTMQLPAGASSSWEGTP